MSAPALLRAPFRPVLRRDPHAELIAALDRLLPGATLLCSRRTPWASTTFAGARHELDYAVAEPARDGVAIAAAAIADAEFALAGHFVAEIRASFDRADGRLAVESLTVEE